MHPFSGTWIANLEKSRRDPNHQFQRAMMRFDIEPEAVTLSHGGVNAAGKEESGGLRMQTDGLERPLPQVPGMASSARWLDTHTLYTEAKKDGQIVGCGTYAVSTDGMTLTATVAGIDGAGRQFEQVIVFDHE
jgi:hypothetical protein